MEDASPEKRQSGRAARREKKEVVTRGGFVGVGDGSGEGYVAVKEGMRYNGVIPRARRGVEGGGAR